MTAAATCRHRSSSIRPIPAAGNGRGGTLPGNVFGANRVLDNDADTEGQAAIDQAQTSIAASTGYKLSISCAQDLIPISVQVQVWSGRPTHQGCPSPSPPALECPTGRLPTGDAVGIELTTGPGGYGLLVTARAQQRRERILAASTSAPGLDLRAAADQHSNLEHYTISLWRTAELEGEEHPAPVNGAVGVLPVRGAHHSGKSFFRFPSSSVVSCEPESASRLPRDDRRRCFGRRERHLRAAHRPAPHEHRLRQRQR